MLIAKRRQKLLLLHSASDKGCVLGDLTNIQSHDTMYITQNSILFQGFFNQNDQI